MDLNILAKESGQLNQISHDSLEKLINGLFEIFISERDSSTFAASSDGQQLGDHYLVRFQSLLPKGEASSQRALLDSLYGLIAHISRSIVKPKLLQKTLTDAGLGTDRTDIFVQLWKDYAPVIVDKLKSTSFERSAQQLQDVHWKLKLISESSYENQQKLPMAQLDLTFSSKTTTHSDLSVNFSHHELMQFYNNLESIQSQIDQLHQ